MHCRRLTRGRIGEQKSDSDVHRTSASAMLAIRTTVTTRSLPGMYWSSNVVF